MSGTSLVFVGSMTRPTPYFETADGDGLSVFSLDEDTGQLTFRSCFTGVDNPSFIAVDPLRQTLYVVSEVYGWNEGTVTALRYDARDGVLHYINKQATQGSCTAHCSFDRTGGYLFATNYAHEKWEGPYQEDTPRQAVCVFPVAPGGAVGPAIATVAHHGSGPRPSRQGEPHPHCAIASPDNRFVLVTDLGIDQVISYRFQDGRLDFGSALKLTPGAGPRHLTFSPDGRFVYLLNELDSTLQQLRYDAQTGELAVIGTLSTIPADFTAENRCSDIQISPDGHFVYCANRGHDSIATFAIDPVSGTPALAAITPCGGRTPRNMGLSPSGRLLMVANQNGHDLSVFRRGGAGSPLEAIARIDIGTPMAIASVPI